MIGRFLRWRDRRGRYPIRWLTYRQRIFEDLREIYRQSDAKDFFTKSYVDAVSAEERRLEDWHVKLLTFQFAITAFLVIGFVSADASVSLFGVSLKNATGIKEVLLALSATVSVIILIVNASKETLIHIIQGITELTVKNEYMDFAKLSLPSSLNLKIYVARQFDRWVFSTFLTKLIFAMLAMLFLILFVLLIVFSIGVSIVLFVEIYRRPTLGSWSIAILVYVSLAWALSLIWLVRFYLPLPYRDQGVLKKLVALEGIDPVGYNRLLEEVFGHGTKRSGHTTLRRRWRWLLLVLGAVAVAIWMILLAGTKTVQGKSASSVMYIGTMTQHSSHALR